MPLGQLTLSRCLQGIPTLDDSTTKGHYTNFNLGFKASIRVYSFAPHRYHSRLYEENFGSMLFEGYKIWMRCGDFTITEVSI
jgi:hypothetical protein